MNPLNIALLQWEGSNKRILKTLETISETDFHKPIVPNGNTPSWLFGHLADTDDMLLELFGIRARIYPELKTIYHHERTTNQAGHLTKAELLMKWKVILETLGSAFAKMNETEWLDRHTAVSEEDFKKEPQRNKLNVLLSRVSHRASHLGQIALLPK